MIRCPNCGELNDPGSRFCFNCGAELSTVPPEPQAPPPPDASLWPQPPAPPSLPGFQPQAPPDEERARYFPPPPPQPQAPPGLPPRPAIPPQYAPPSYSEGSPYGQPAGWGGQPGQRSGWGALDELDPPPPPRRRATWLMVLLGIVAGCLLVCVGTFVYALTPPGQDTFEDIGTVIAEFATEAAPEPTRER